LLRASAVATRQRTSSTGEGMPASFRVLSGGVTGTVYTPDTDSFTAGRHPAAELRFHPEHDAGVSGSHARFVLHQGRWYVQDLQSRNGTFVNGQPVTDPRVLEEGDRIVLGTGGPELLFSTAAAEPGPATLRVRAAVRRERRRAVAAAGALAVLALGVTALVLADARAQETELLRERAALEARIDSLITAGRESETSLEVEVAGLQQALRSSEQTLRRLRSQLDASRPGGAAEEELRRDLIATSAALRRQQLAAALDFALIQRRARGAVVMVWVEYADGERTTGTAFAVRPDGTLLTNRHLVAGADGSRRAGRIAVRFADSDQTFPARIVDISMEWDLAALRVENVIGDVPAVPGFNMRFDTVAPGTPVALIGYPLGGEAERSASARRVARPVVSAALLLRTSARAVEVQGLGAAGASGSPILDGAGEVIAVLYGGRPDDAGSPVLLGVPARAAAQFIAALPR
jgi:S1-C subfamily serine protease